MVIATHDVDFARDFAEEPAKPVLDNPSHPATRELLAKKGTPQGVP